MANQVSVNLYTITHPLYGETVENRPLTPDSRGGANDVRHVTFQFQGPFSYQPGQSIGVLPPGNDPTSGKPHKLRLYSVSSTRLGDGGDGKTASICVVRHFWRLDAKSGERIPGVASNYLCDLKKSDQVQITGPVGRHFLLPENHRLCDFIFVATGTGIAPYRGMLKEMFE